MADPGGYPGPGEYPTGGGHPAERDTTLATVALVLALLTLLPGFGVLTGLAGFVTGLVALGRIRRGEAGGHGRAVAAVVIAVALFLVQALLVVVVAVAVSAGPASS